MYIKTTANRKPINNEQNSRPQRKHRLKLLDINRIYRRSPMQTEKSQPERKRIMPETRFTEFPALSVYLRVGISRSALETDD